MKIQIESKIIIEGVPEYLLKELKNRLSFVNPKWEENEKRGYSNWKTPRTLEFYDELVNGELKLPRGFIRQYLWGALDTYQSEMETQQKINELQRYVDQGLKFTYIEFCCESFCLQDTENGPKVIPSEYRDGLPF